MRLGNGKWYHLAFKAGIALKAFDGILEVIAGIALMATSEAAIHKLIHNLTREELLEDPHDFFANHLVDFFNHLSIHTKHFAAFYLLAHGVIKVGLAIGLFFDKLWSFPVAMIFFSLFILYQAYRLGETHSIGLALLTIFDAVILILIWFEYGRVKSNRNQ